MAIMPLELPQLEYLHSVFVYDPVSGIIKWRYRADKAAAWNGRFAGKDAGCVAPNGYKQIRLNGRGMRYHRIAWALSNGELPRGCFIDHADGDRLNNAIKNLRLATHSDNQCNRKRKIGLTWPKGVVFNKRKGFFNAYIRTGGRKVNLGVFRTAPDAHAAYRTAAMKHHGEFARFD